MGGTVDEGRWQGKPGHAKGKPNVEGLFDNLTIETANSNVWQLKFRI
jgi:hypothetical protein